MPRHVCSRGNAIEQTASCAWYQRSVLEPLRKGLNSQSLPILGSTGLFRLSFLFLPVLAIRLFPGSVVERQCVMMVMVASIRMNPSHGVGVGFNQADPAP
jgi:hypothetical protein